MDGHGSDRGARAGTRAPSPRSAEARQEERREGDDQDEAEG